MFCLYVDPLYYFFAITCRFPSPFFHVFLVCWAVYDFVFSMFQVRVAVIRKGVLQGAEDALEKMDVTLQNA